MNEIEKFFNKFDLSLTGRNKSKDEIMTYIEKYIEIEADYSKVKSRILIIEDILCMYSGFRITDWNFFEPKNNNKTNELLNILHRSVLIDIGPIISYKDQLPLVYAIDMEYYKTNNIDDILLNKEMLRIISPEFSIKSVFMTSEEMKVSWKYQLIKNVKTALEESDFINSMYKNLPEIVLSFYEKNKKII